MATEQDLLVYGCDMEEFKTSVLESMTYQHSGGGMILVSMLSDVQEMIERGQKEPARQLINRVKHLIMDADDNQQIRFPRIKK